MAWAPLNVTDANFLVCNLLTASAAAQIHGENADAIEVAQKLTFDAGITGPEGHSLSRPAFIEVSRSPPDKQQVMSIGHMLQLAALPAPSIHLHACMHAWILHSRMTRLIICHKHKCKCKCKCRCKARLI